MSLKCSKYTLIRLVWIKVLPLDPGRNPYLVTLSLGSAPLFILAKNVIENILEPFIFLNWTYHKHVTRYCKKKNTTVV